MPIFLDEDMAGTDAALIGFPHLLVCLGLLVKADGGLYGLHITSIEATDETVNGFALYLAAQGVTQGTMQALYSAANFPVRYKGVGSSTSNWVALWRVEMERIARKIGYRGVVYGFDTAIITPKDGTYVEYHAKPAVGACRIFYKRNEKLAYTSAIGVPGIQKIKNGLPVPWAGVIRTSAAVNPGSNLTEVDYATRLTSFFA